MVTKNGIKLKQIMKNLINWSELSRLLTNGDRGNIRSNKTGKKYKKIVDDLLKRLKEWKDFWSLKS